MERRFCKGTLVIHCERRMISISCSSYDIIQLPHHGQENDAKAIFEKLGGNAYSKDYFISDNTGSGKTSGGSDDIVKYMKRERYNPPYSTKDKIVNLPECSVAIHSSSQGRVPLGDLGSV